MAKAIKLTEQVTDFIKKSEHPLHPVMTALRELMLQAQKDITEHIKWNAPSFCYNGEDRITFNLSRKECILLIFHRGAKAKDSKRGGTLFEDTTGLLKWLSPDRAMIKICNLEEVSEKKKKLTSVIKQWIKETT